ncbi:hypothetical protein H5410_057043 [Solanum commersonii]|uniref:Uncharacterized protein n=1 Tax=Solanum commersonii TaxID=4109 RepID=A0A9J5WNJ3_SOLCO|nr:hypothetical protein H5410_057043 [Solanum commersonii]
MVFSFSLSSNQGKLNTFICLEKTRVHGLPLHLWYIRVMKEMSDKCGGWLENEEETELKNHL